MLVVDTLWIKYQGKEGAQHLINDFQEKYEVTQE